MFNPATFVLLKEPLEEGVGSPSEALPAMALGVAYAVLAASYLWLLVAVFMGRPGWPRSWERRPWHRGWFVWRKAHRVWRVISVTGLVVGLGFVLWRFSPWCLGYPSDHPHLPTKVAFMVPDLALLAVLCALLVQFWRALAGGRDVLFWAFAWGLSVPTELSALSDGVRLGVPGLLTVAAALLLLTVSIAQLCICLVAAEMVLDAEEAERPCLTPSDPQDEAQDRGHEDG